MSSQAEYQHLINQIDGWKWELAKWMDRAENAETTIAAMAHEIKRLNVLLQLYGAPEKLLAVDPAVLIGQNGPTRDKDSSSLPGLSLTSRGMRKEDVLTRNGKTAHPPANPSTALSD